MLPGILLSNRETTTERVKFSRSFKIMSGRFVTEGILRVKTLLGFTKIFHLKENPKLIDTLRSKV